MREFAWIRTTGRKLGHVSSTAEPSPQSNRGMLSARTWRLNYATVVATTTHSDTFYSRIAPSRLISSRVSETRECHTSESVTLHVASYIVATASPYPPNWLDHKRLTTVFPFQKSHEEKKFHKEIKDAESL